MKQAECVNFPLLYKELCATQNYQSEYDIIHSVHYSYNQSHLPTNAYNRITNYVSFTIPTWHQGTILRESQIQWSTSTNMSI
jgi:hypothetical protein